MGGKGFRRHGRVVWPGFSYNPRPRQILKVGRNDPCPCGSGRKYKECHEKAGTKYLEKLAWQQEKQRHKEARWREKGLPWYRRLFRRGTKAEDPESSAGEPSDQEPAQTSQRD
jgi:hypothetical protein